MPRDSLDGSHVRRRMFPPGTFSLSLSLSLSTSFTSLLLAELNSEELGVLRVWVMWKQAFAPADRTPTRPPDPAMIALAYVVQSRS